MAAAGESDGLWFPSGKEKAGFQADFDNIVVAGIVAILASPLGSAQREFALMDMHDLLAPYHDDPFKVGWGTLNAEYLDDSVEERPEKKSVISYRRRNMDVTPTGDGVKPGFQRDWFVLMLRLMKRKGMLPPGFL